jgi:UDP-2,3-diacylglucosamine pyrophosphatase LpxH
LSADLELHVRTTDDLSGAIRGDALFLSDTHLGWRSAKSGRLLDLLRRTHTEEIYLVGDIIDFWKLKSGLTWCREDEAVAHKLVKIARDRRVVYLVGNHDAVLLPYVGDNFAGVEIEREVIYEASNGLRYLAFHGDQLDHALVRRQWVGAIGSLLYDVALVINEGNLWARKKLGYQPWSFSMWAKHAVKASVNAMGRFEDAAVEFARQKGADGAITGHVHRPAVQEFYVNCGDWVENCTAVVDRAGQMHLVRG